MTTIKDLVHNPRNPRKITDSKLKMLDSSIDKFGDCSGIVFNRRFQRLAGGHQRTKTDSLPDDSVIEITERYDEPNSVGTVAIGFVLDKNGEKHKYREVDWDEDTEKAANIAANKHGGEWDFPLLADQLMELDQKNYDMKLTGYDDEEMEKVMTYVPDAKGSSSSSGSSKPEIDPSKLCFSQDEIIQDAFKYFREKGFPYRDLPLFEMKQELNKLATLQLDNCLNSKAGYQIADTFHKHRFHAAANGMISPFDAFQDDKKLLKSLRMEYLNGGIDQNYIAFINLVNGTQSCSNFRPAFARMLYEKYCAPGGRVFDSSTGYGGRLVGFLGSHCHEYVGTDPNVPTFMANCKMAETLQGLKKVYLFNSPIEDLDVTHFVDSCDFAFTSPPYFTKEIYSTDSTQSCMRYPGYDEWLTSFLKPMLIKNYQVLKQDKYCVINIEDVKLKGKLFPLVQPTIDIGIEVGFTYIEMKQFGLNSRTYIVDGEKHVEEAAESVIIFKKNKVD